jgi:hypothetical protein
MSARMTVMKFVRWSGQPPVYFTMISFMRCSSISIVLSSTVWRIAEEASNKWFLGITVGVPRYYDTSSYCVLGSGISTRTCSDGVSWNLTKSWSPTDGVTSWAAMTRCWRATAPQ